MWRRLSADGHASVETVSSTMKCVCVCAERRGKYNNAHTHAYSLVQGFPHICVCGAKEKIQKKHKRIADALHVT